MASRHYRQFRFTRPPGACELLLVRHGESAAADPDNPFPTVDGQGDPELHPEGVHQAHLASQRLIASGEDFAGVYVTTLRRTHETAQPLLDHLGMEPIVEPDLREVFLGDYEGGELRKRAAEGDETLAQVWMQQRWDVIPNSESDVDFTNRVRGAVERIATTHADGTVAVFTHGGVIGKILQIATGSLGLAFAGADNASISHVVVHEDRWVVRAYNDTAHLAPRFTRDPQPLL